MRNSILQRFKEMEDETPETKRRRYEKAGIKTPEEATTPYWMEYKRQQLEERRTRFAPTQEQIDKIKKRTVNKKFHSEFRVVELTKIMHFSLHLSQLANVRIDPSHVEGGIG